MRLLKLNFRSACLRISVSNNSKSIFDVYFATPINSSDWTVPRVGRLMVS